MDSQCCCATMTLVTWRQPCDFHCNMNSPCSYTSIYWPDYQDSQTTGYQRYVLVHFVVLYRHGSQETKKVDIAEDHGKYYEACLATSEKKVEFFWSYDFLKRNAHSNSENNNVSEKMLQN